MALILVPSILGYIGSAEESANKANARTVYSELALKLALDETYSAPTGCTINFTGTTLENIDQVTSIVCTNAGTGNPGTFTPGS